MASEYFASLHYIWLNIVIFIFSLFLFAVCLYACLFVRWVYKRRLRQKADAMIQCYKNGEDKRREMELKMKRKELHPVPEKKKPTGKQRKVHIVSKPCNEVIQKNANEYIVRQVNEGTNEEVACSPIPMPAQKSFIAPPAQQMQTQYVMVPVEVLRSQIKNNRHICSPIVPVVYQGQNQKMIVESVATQTSEVAVNVVEKKTPDDWLAGYDERDAEKEDDRIDVDDEPDDNESDKVMKKRKNPRYKKKRHSVEKKEEKPVALSEETRVSIENDAPPSAAPPSTSDSTTPSTTSTTTPTSAPISTDPAAEEKKPETDEKDKKGFQEKEKGPEDDPAFVKSNYFTMPGENNAANNDQQPAPPPAQKQAAPASRPSIFPYFVDPKAPEAETTTDKRVAKLTEPRLDHTDSSCALYRGKVKSRTPKSEKVYSGAPKPAKK